MSRRRVTMFANVNLDGVPGVMYTPESAKEVITSILDTEFRKYNPRVELAGRVNNHNYGRRVSFLISIEIDTAMGPMRTRDTAIQFVGAAIYAQISHYHPHVFDTPQKNLARR